MDSEKFRLKAQFLGYKNGWIPCNSAEPKGQNMSKKWGSVLITKFFLIAGHSSEVTHLFRWVETTNYGSSRVPHSLGWRMQHPTGPIGAKERTGFAKLGFSTKNAIGNPCFPPWKPLKTNMTNWKMTTFYRTCFFILWWIFQQFSGV